MAHGTAKVTCKCPHEFQDSKYGKQTRVANATEKGDNTQTEVRCTVCKAVHRVSNSQVKR